MADWPGAKVLQEAPREGYGMSDRNSKQILWREEFSIGVPSIDDQHKRLLALLNRLNSFDHEQAKHGPQASPLMEILENLNEYAAHHFLNEEALMRKHLVPDENTVNHIVAHRSYWTIILTLKNRLLKGDAKVNRDLVEYLNGWWINHILKTDREMGRELSRRGVE
ncbi:MAG: bacteriohemerythrin [Sterolibacterium sp.]